MTKDEELKAAYLAGFNASGEGYNSEYPFEHKGKNCTDDPIWCKDRDNELAAIKQAIAAQQEPVKPSLWEQYHAAQPAPVQEEPVAKYIGECSEGSLVQLYEDVKKGTNFYTTPPAQPAPVQPIIGSYLEKDNSQFKFSDYEPDGVHHNKPAVPDAFGTREGEHPQYIQGWNDCRAEMLKGMKL